MRKLIIVLPILLACFIASAQKGIKYDVDDRTGDTLFSTKEKTLYIKSGAKHSVAEYLKSTVYKSKTGFMLNFQIQTGRTSVFSISKGASAELTLEDGSVVTLYTLNGSQSRPSRLDYGAFLFVFYRMDAATVRQLKNVGIRNIRIQSSTGEMEYPLKEKMSGIIGEQIALF